MNRTTRLICRLSAGLLLGNGGIFEPKHQRRSRWCSRPLPFAITPRGSIAMTRNSTASSFPTPGRGIGCAQRAAVRVPRPGHRGDLLLPLVDLSEASSSRRRTGSSSRSSCRRCRGRASTTRSIARRAITSTRAAGSHDPRYLDDYAVFWFRKGGEPRRYSFWAADAM